MRDNFLSGYLNYLPSMNECSCRKHKIHLTCFQASSCRSAICSWIGDMPCTNRSISIVLSKLTFLFILRFLRDVGTLLSPGSAWALFPSKQEPRRSGPDWGGEAQVGFDSGKKLFCVLKLEEFERKKSQWEKSQTTYIIYLAEYFIHRGIP